jgi:hypothetical protein
VVARLKTRRPPPLTPAAILRWCDHHRRRTGNWPTRRSGAISAAPAETWSAVDDALKRGGRGLPRGSSLAQLLAQHRGRRHFLMQPPLAIDTILKWADAHFKRSGQWPTQESGPVHGVPHESWAPIDAALRYGRRGLRGGSSLVRLLARERGRHYQAKGGPLTERQIIQWAKAFHKRSGTWPSRRTPGSVKGTSGDTWTNIDNALREGLRGLPGGTTLLMLLAKRCGMRHRKLPPRLTVKQILTWADAHRRRSGRWPSGCSGPVAGVEGETWLAIDDALRRGVRGLQGKSSLALLLEQKRGRTHHLHRPRLTVNTILAWADAHHQRTGRWPHSASGPVAGAPDEDWGNINAALFAGRRGLPDGTSLRTVLVEHRAKVDRFSGPRLTIDMILEWADSHHARSGSWPDHLSGPIPEAPGQSWNAIYHALQRGKRGLKGRSTIVSLLARHRGVRHRLHPPPLTYKQILDWADAYYQRTGDWPSRHTGPIADARGETWSHVAKAMQSGSRGLRRRSSLVKLLSQKRPDLYRRRGIPLKRSEILDWITAHHELTGALPTPQSGPVRDQPGETWAAIDASLRSASRGLRGRETLQELLDRHYVPPYPGCGEPLTEATIIRWAKEFKKRVGRQPTSKSAYTDPSRTEQWSVIDIALREGLRGLPGGSSLAKLLRDARPRTGARAPRAR